MAIGSLPVASERYVRTHTAPVVVLTRYALSSLPGTTWYFAVSAANDKVPKRTHAITKRIAKAHLPLIFLTLMFRKNSSLRHKAIATPSSPRSKRQRLF